LTIVKPRVVGQLDTVDHALDQVGERFGVQLGGWRRHVEAHRDRSPEVPSETTDETLDKSHRCRSEGASAFPAATSGRPY
jgi:hypothetical protein